jgi:hypothetical protein
MHRDLKIEKLSSKPKLINYLCKSSAKKKKKPQRPKHGTRDALGYIKQTRTMILDIPCEHLTLGESTTTPPQRVNGINLPNPSLFNTRCSVVTQVQLI